MLTYNLSITFNEMYLVQNMLLKLIIVYVCVYVNNDMLG